MSSCLILVLDYQIPSKLYNVPFNSVEVGAFTQNAAQFLEIKFTNNLVQYIVLLIVIYVLLFKYLIIWIY